MPFLSRTSAFVVSDDQNSNIPSGSRTKEFLHIASLSPPLYLRNKMSAPHPSRSTTTDPFMGQDNFPSIDDALVEGDDQQAEESFVAPSDVSMSYLSVGARAALAEHQRHIAKYGLDGPDPETGTTTNVNVAPEPPQEETSTAYRDELDEVWEQLLDGNNISHISNTSFHTMPETFWFDRIITSASDDGQEAIEVMADQSSDYFNSSRVNLLRTPEKNLNTKIEVTQRREGTTVEESFSSGGSSGQAEQDIMMMQLFPLPSPFPDLEPAPNDHDVVSLSAVDVSRISADGSDLLLQPSGTKTSPETSFTLQGHRETIDEIRQFLPPLRGSPSRSPARAGFHDSKIAASGRSPPRQERLARHGTGAKSSLKLIAHGGRLEKENTRNMDDSLALSPISRAAAASAASYQLPRSMVESRLAFLESQASKSMVAARRTDPINTMIVQDNAITRGEDSDLSTLYSSSENRKTSSSLSSSNSNSNPSLSHLPPLTDRRIFRTVVPSRVFLTETQDFPEQYDSFSAPLPLCHHRRPQEQSFARSCHSAPR